MRSRTVGIVVFDGVQGLDVFGPADVFYFANHYAQRVAATAPPYTVELVAQRPGPVTTASGPALVATRSLEDPDLRPDVLLVAGGLDTPEVATDDSFVDALRALARRSGEVGAICTGAVLLAAAGLLDGRRATTHWALAEDLSRGYPDVRLDPDRIFVFDGVWTSAGVTAGVDLALQMVRTHHGAEMAVDAARHLVVYLQRAGGQQQFSTHLAAQVSTNDVVAELTAHIADHPDDDLSVTALAGRAHMSERSFHRLFTAEVGMSPGRYVVRARVDAARARLENTRDPVSAVARQCGFANQETFLRTFRRVVGVTPTQYRHRFSARPEPTGPHR